MERVRSLYLNQTNMGNKISEVKRLRLPRLKIIMHIKCLQKLNENECIPSSSSAGVSIVRLSIACSCLANTKSYSICWSISEFLEVVASPLLFSP
ncbi:Os06g0125700 [Oryza sativa Japonica Group]|uniref:Os06g0125700 protein n=2 Tax=Oryza sativa subsp. japonica TaxID=39947 RepID=Q0DF05_ORYSJ|nr:hypothetical protein EE612_031655 [Oryza sativa]BAF18568.1 Os06g0125700 [Oryza sativa Japonica Group]BAS95918.1 Os06g0125700 [Oryza sativa Japonica Group]|eukprot:NP_001056654.1 Os06g0125700 [Oryza sativa Japonica Group]